jgi:two-component system, NarL family, response regulator LiaR
MTMTSPKPIRVMLVDDHTMVRKGLATFLKVFDDLELAGEAADGEEAIQLCAEILPDVVLMDLVMPGVEGAVVTRHIRRQFPTVQVIVLTSFKEEKRIHDALQAGAIGYLLKDVSAEELAQAIRAAYAGRSTLSPVALQTMVQAAMRPPTPGHDLTEREWAVLALLVAGMNNTEIAEKLVVSPSTIKSHVSHILQKLDVSSRTEAAAFAVRHNMVD